MEQKTSRNPTLGTESDLPSNAYREKIGSERVCLSSQERIQKIIDARIPEENVASDLIKNSMESISASDEGIRLEKEVQATGGNSKNSLDASARTPIRRLWFAIANTSVARKLSESTLDRAGIAGIFATLASAPILNLGSNIWLYHSIAKPLSGIDFLSFSSVSGTVGWTMFIGGMGISLTNFLISRGRLFNVWTFCKLAVSNDPQIAHLHLQRNLRNINFTDLRTKLDLFSDDVLQSLSEIAKTEHEVFQNIQEVRMSSWMLDKPRIRREMIGRIRSEGFDCEEIPGEDGWIGIWKKLGLCSLTIGKKGFFQFAKGLFSRKLAEGGIHVWIKNTGPNRTEP